MFVDPSGESKLFHSLHQKHNKLLCESGSSGLKDVKNLPFHCKLSETWSKFVNQAHAESETQCSAERDRQTKPTVLHACVCVYVRVCVCCCAASLMYMLAIPDCMLAVLFLCWRVWKHALKFSLIITLNAALSQPYKTLLGNHQIFIQHYPWSYSL